MQIDKEAYGLSFWLFDFSLALLLLAKYDRKSLFKSMMSKDHKLKIKTSYHGSLTLTHAKKKIKIEQNIQNSNVLFRSN